MAEPLSITSSLASLIAIGLHVSRVTCQIIGDTRSAPNAIKSLNVQLSGLCKALGSLSTLLETNPLQTLPGFPIDELSGLLDNIMNDFKDLQEIVNGYQANPADGVIRQHWKQFLWGFKESDVDNLTKSIEAYKATLTLTTSIATISGISHMAEQTRNQMTKFETELQEVRSLCQYLKDRGLASSEMSLRKVPSYGSASLPLVRILSSSSSASNDTVASSYRAASFIDYYCDGIEAFYAIPASEGMDGTVVQPFTNMSPRERDMLGDSPLDGFLLLPLRAVKLGRLVLNPDCPDLGFVDPFDGRPSETESLITSKANETWTDLKNLKRQTYSGHFIYTYKVTLSTPLARTHSLINPEAWLEKACAEATTSSFLNNAMYKMRDVYLIFEFLTAQDGRWAKCITPKEAQVKRQSML